MRKRVLKNRIGKIAQWALPDGRPKPLWRGEGPVRGSLRTRRPLWPGRPHEGSRWEGRGSGRTHRFALTSDTAPRQGRMSHMIIIPNGASLVRNTSARRASFVAGVSDAHAPLRGAGVFGSTNRWVHPLARTSHR